MKIDSTDFKGLLILEPKLLRDSRGCFMESYNRRIFLEAGIDVVFVQDNQSSSSRGFFGKFYIFKAALDANLVWLTILGLLSSAVAAYYYLRIIVVMYMHEPGPATENVPSLAVGIKTALWISAIATLILGVFPTFVLDFAGKSADLVK